MPLVPPPIYTLAAAGVQHVLAPDRATGTWRRVLAASVAAGSAGLMGAAARRFFAVGTTVEPFDPSEASVLVTDGANALTRNPMYAGMAGLLAAHALARGGWLTWLPAAGFVALIDRVQVRPEEAALSVRFGAEYDEYRRRVRRWV
jgi:protein-S-isoprenylcysteine O-methyltransferase Ste14